MNVMWDAQERSCEVCGRVFIPKAPKAKYCSEECRRKHEQNPREGGPAQGCQAEARQGRPLSGAHGPGARRDHGHAARGRDEILSFRR